MTMRIIASISMLLILAFAIGYRGDTTKCKYQVGDVVRMKHKKDDILIIQHINSSCSYSLLNENYEGQYYVKEEMLELKNL